MSRSSAELAKQVYLTIMFLVPLSSTTLTPQRSELRLLTCAVTDMYTFKSAQRTRSNGRLRRVAMRTFIGAICTLTSSVV